METETMGRVVTEATIENLEDLWAAKRGLIPADQVRRVRISDALVDTGATFLSLPSAFIQGLGLRRTGSRRSQWGTGPAESAMYGAVRLTIRGRDCSMDVFEVLDGTPVVIGQIPLTHLDFAVDHENRQLIGNPAHEGEHMYEMY